MTIWDGELSELLFFTYHIFLELVKTQDLPRYALIIRTLEMY
jgi:hypothetical protein